MIDKFNLKIDTRLYEFINNEVLQGLDLDKEIFWSNFSNIVDDFGHHCQPYFGWFAIFADSQMPNH